MRRVFKSSFKCRGDSGILLWGSRLVKFCNAKADPKKIGDGVISANVDNFATRVCKVPETFLGRTEKVRSM